MQFYINYCKSHLIIKNAQDMVANYVILKLIQMRYNVLHSFRMF